MYAFYSLIVTLLTIVVTLFVKKQIYIRRCVRNFPGPPNLPFFGCALDFMGNKGMITVFREYQKKYGGIVYGRIGPVIHSLIFTNAEFAKAVFLANFNLSKGNAYDFTRSWLGEGLLTTPEEKWKAQRKMLMPAFSNQLLTSFIKIFERQSNTLIESIEAITPTKSTNIHPFVSLCSLDIIGETSMGVLMNAQIKQNTEYVRCVKEMCRIIAERSMSVWKSNKMLYPLSIDFWVERKCVKYLHDYTDKVIKERREQRKRNKTNDQSSDKETTISSEDTKHIGLLDILLDFSDNEKLLTEAEIRQEVHTFLFAGHDTVTAAMSFFLFEIARQPEIQRQIYEEQISIFGSDIGRQTSLMDLHEMRYLDMAIKETLRLYPPVPVYTRQTTKEFVYNGQIIPKDITLVHFAHGLHRNEKVFPNPEIFDPSRFAKTDSQFVYSYLPFSTGPRNCIGQKFAMYEMKVILSKILRYFEISVAEPEHTLDIKAEVVLVSKNGINVKITRRK